jgi:hypothetical protein
MVRMIRDPEISGTESTRMEDRAAATLRTPIGQIQDVPDCIDDAVVTPLSVTGVFGARERVDAVWIDQMPRSCIAHLDGARWRAALAAAAR